MISFFCPNHHAHARRPSLIETEEEARPFTLRELSGALDFRFEYEDNQDKGGGQTSQQRRTRYEELLDLKGRGSVYHPNFLEFGFNTSFGLRQEFFRGNFEDDTNTIPYEYGVNLNFLKTKPYNFNLFANRSTSTVSRQFFEPVKTESENYGGIFNYRNNLFPLSLLLQDSHTQEDSVDYKSDRKEKTAEFKVSNKLKDFLQSDFSYTYKELIEEINVRREVLSHNLYLNNTLHSGKTNWFSMISYNKTSGDIPTELFQINENFYVDHSKTFTTFYDYNYTESATQNFKTNSHRGDIGLRHRLYDSLVTEIKGEIGQTHATDFQESYRGGGASFAYNKKVPGGTFLAGYNFLYRRVDREAPAGTVRILGERIVLLDSRRTFLANPNVVLSSVIVRDASGVVLLLNIDYRLITSGNLTEIQRVNLPDNTPVLVDYDFSSPLTLNYAALTNGVNLRYDYHNLLSFYYRYLSTWQERISDAPRADDNNILPDTQKNLYGAELRWRWFTLGTEYEDDNSDLNPFFAWRIRGTFSVSPTFSSQFGLNASHSRTEYKNDRDILTYENVDVLYNLRLNSFLETEIGAGYLSQRGRDMDTRAWRLKGELKSRFRAIEIRLRSEYLKRYEISRERDEFLIRFNILRNFDIL